MRCVKAYGDCLTVGKEYSVLKIRMEVEVRDDEGGRYYWESDHFEPVLDSAENPLQNIELTPEFEAVEPTFKAGDKVYCRIHEPKIFTILGVDSDNTAHFGESDKYGYEWWSFKNLCHATQENYERLQATFPAIEFEQPPKPLTGSDLARAMLQKGWNLVPCVVSDKSDNDALIQDYVAFVNEWNGKEFEHGDTAICVFAVPFDPRTGEPLTESVLND